MSRDVRFSFAPASLFGTPFFGLLDTRQGLDDLLAPSENPPAVRDYNERVEACRAGRVGELCFTDAECDTEEGGDGACGLETLAEARTAGTS